MPIAEHVVRASLLHVYDQHGELTPQLVVDEATDPAHPLHNAFTWDDAEAGPKHRLREAQALIRRVKVRRVNPAIDDQPVVRQWVSVQRPDRPTPTYEPIEKVARDPMSTAILLRQAERDWRLYKQRYLHLSEVINMIRTDTEVNGDVA